MDEDFDNDNDVEMADDDLNEPLGDDLGDMAEGSTGGDADADGEFEDSRAVSGTRATGGARANAKLAEPESASSRASRAAAPKAKKAAAPAKKRAPVKAAATIETRPTRAAPTKVGRRI